MIEKSVPKWFLYVTLDAAMKRASSIQKVALYARVSTKDKGQDTENQLGQLREFCEKQGWEIAGEYVDHESAFSGKRRTRFDQLFTDAQQRKFDLVLFWSLDRFSREGTLSTLKKLDELEKYGVFWRSLMEPYLDSAGIFRDVVVSLISTVARQESARRSERSKAAIEKLRRQGKTEHLGRPQLIVNRKRIQDLHKTGLSIRKIAAEVGLEAPPPFTGSSGARRRHSGRGPGGPVTST
jgi:DNA invertase Pin-like site-specific DNA recombinase